MRNPLHTVLGASGTTGRAVLKELQNRNLRYNAVERTKKLQNVDTIEADLLKLDEAICSIQNSSYVYLCVGLPYDSKVWQRDWPILMQHVITACEKANAVLIFLDNVYMYASPLSIPFDEQTAQNPKTKKGIVRKQVADLLFKAISEKRVKGVIGRSADFYGEYATSSVFYNSFLENMLKGKAPQMLSKLDVPHTYAFSGDNGRALVALALDEGTYGQVWHLPVGKPITFEEVADIINDELGTKFNPSYVPKLIRKILGVFIPPIGEVEEMLDQFQQPYEMNADKFKNSFPDFQITPYREGIKKMIKSFRND